MRRIVVLGLLLSVLTFGVAAAPGSAPVLTRVVLKPSQVGTGFQLKQRQDGHGVRGFVTLDLCGFGFPSEKLRTDRLQVNYVRAGTVRLSNEVVTYRPGGAAQALREIAKAAAHCPKGPVGSHVGGVPPLTYRITPVKDSRLLPKHVAFRVDVSGKVNGRPYAGSVYAVYQIRGSVLSGVYAYGRAPAVRRLMLHAGEAVGKNLTRWA